MKKAGYYDFDLESGNQEKIKQWF